MSHRHLYEEIMREFSEESKMGDATDEYCKKCDTKMEFDGDSYYCPECIKKPGVDAFNITAGSEKLAEDHWNYVQQVILEAKDMDLPDQHIIEIGFHYKTAFVHGYKHSQEGD